MRAIVFVVLAAFILLAPAVPQVFGHASPLFRPWAMYSGVGIGIIDGRFTLTGPEGQRALAPLEVAGAARWPRPMPRGDRIRSADDVRAFAARFCDGLPRGARLSFEGAVGTRGGWRPLDVADVCPAAAEPGPDGAPEVAAGD